MTFLLVPDRVVTVVSYMSVCTTTRAYNVRRWWAAAPATRDSRLAAANVKAGPKAPGSWDQGRWRAIRKCPNIIIITFEKMPRGSSLVDIGMRTTPSTPSIPRFHRTPVFALRAASFLVLLAQGRLPLLVPLFNCIPVHLCVPRHDHFQAIDRDATTATRDPRVGGRHV